jgi:hypothetical protein
MQIHVARDSAQLGVFTPEEITAGLRSGRFLAADLAWRDGMPAWTPLGDWPEFHAPTAPASPSALTAESPVASTIPWEQGKSLGSFFATIKLALANPAALSTGRFAFGDWLAFCYLALAFSLPFQAIHLAIAEDPNQALGNFLKSLSYPEVQAIADQMLKSPPAPLWASGAGLVGGLAFAPLMYAFFALLHWVGQRIFRLRIAVERTVSATLLVSGALILLMAPFQLLAFSFVAQLALSALFLIPACILYFRALGAATGVNPWAQFGISCFVWSVLCCCCCFLPGVLLWGAAAAR